MNHDNISFGIVVPIHYEYSWINSGELTTHKTTLSSCGTFGGDLNSRLSLSIYFPSQLSIHHAVRRTTLSLTL